MNKTIHRSESRGYSDHGWLKTYHTFSFAGYYDPARVNFGALRALNDDTVEGGQGFGIHPHDNMEIVSIPLEGVLAHADSMGNDDKLLHPGQIQVMSAGTGILHSEFNGSPTQPLEFLQIWIFPDRQGLTPRYEDVALRPVVPNELQLIVAPAGSGSEHVGWIHQQAWFYLATIDPDVFIKYRLHSDDSGVYIFVISGSITAADESLAERDGMGVFGTEDISLRGERRSRILLMEVPMKW